MSPVKVLFLDIDGVLHPEPCDRADRFVHRDTFEGVVRTFPDIELVISSTWRQTRTLSGLQDLFSPDVAVRLVGVTPFYRDLEDVPTGLLGYEREAECVAWLRKNERVYQDWLAIDDRAWNFRPFCQNLFLTDPAVGFDAMAAIQLKRRLESRG